MQLDSAIDLREQSINPIVSLLINKAVLLSLLELTKYVSLFSPRTMVRSAFVVIDINGFKEKVSIDIHKAAYLENKTQASSPIQGPVVPSTPEPTYVTNSETTTTLMNSPTSIFKKTKSGRTIRPRGEYCGTCATATSNW